MGYLVRGARGSMLAGVPVGPWGTWRVVPVGPCWHRCPWFHDGWVLVGPCWLEREKEGERERERE